VSRLSDIPIRVLPSVAAPAAGDGLGGGLGGGVHAILAELVTLLEGLVDLEHGGMIDLHSLPMDPRDRTALQHALGKGEVHATLDAQGLSQFQETSVPGIWWIEHRDPSGELVAELLEVAAVPAILACARDEIATGPGVLRSRIAGLDTRAGQGGHDRHQ